MQDEPAAPPPDMSPARSNALFIATLLAALLGLTLLDVEPTQPHRGGTADGTRSIDCIVASAIFAGVSASAPEFEP